MVAVRVSLALALLLAGPSLGYNATEDVGNMYETSSDVSESLYDFPTGFMVGAASAAYQIEGAWNVSGKGESIWDVYFHDHPNLTNGDVACDSYYKYKKDVKLLKNTKLTTYRFSISWPRILPNGSIHYIDQTGIDYYNNLINYCLNHSITPMVTMYHWDLPEALQDLGGWAGNTTIQDLFVDYANLLFYEFGDRVQWWITFNEPLSFCPYYDEDDELAGPDYDAGVSVYQCSYNVLLAHAKVYDLYYANYSLQGGQVGITNIAPYSIPLDPASTSDKEAAEQYMVWSYAWFVDPVINGNWPDSMIEIIAAKSKAEGLSESRLPSFTEEEQELLAGSVDFLGTNHYIASLATYTSNSTDNSTCSNSSTLSYDSDMGVTVSVNSSWKLGTHWSTKTPWGFRGALNWIMDRYENWPVFVTENGYNGNYEEHLKDYNRIAFISTYMRAMLRAVNEDYCNVLGYIHWSIMDNLEWLNGFNMRFGLHYVNFNSTARTRTAKKSVTFLKNAIKKEYVTYYAYPSS